MKKYLNNYDNQGGDTIIVFPEGILLPPNILGEFRSGAFNTGYPVQPIICKYNQPIFDSNSFKNELLNILSLPDLTVTLDILSVCHSPFNPIKINNIRNTMANKGNYILSRITTK